MEDKIITKPEPPEGRHLKEGELPPEAKEIKQKKLNFSIIEYFGEMKFGSKIAVVIGMIIVLLFMAFEAFSLLSMASDIAVIVGIVILLILVAIVISACTVLCRKLYNTIN